MYQIWLIGVLLRKADFHWCVLHGEISGVNVFVVRTSNSVTTLHYVVAICLTEWCFHLNFFEFCLGFKKTQLKRIVEIFWQKYF